ncbi:M90 family metallopeptidase [Roseateles oligotrophus]|uniref:Zinc-dependent peptidase n=1 Tax=Roseateles oligotrophus TaxID=1769250 RepID=A0ABT2YEX1_9BURK|nr:M90 family metallopeptidase [Roseateles oligotrophus]MCV2368595.1 zinc-dependent peptidase [Roseateles oligotrophus]
MDINALPLLLTIAFGLGLIAWLAGGPLLQRRRRQKLREQPFPQAWRRILRRRVPLVQRLPADLQLRLKQDIQVFLAEKPILGCGGLTVTDEMRVSIAAQACLPLLGARRGYYPQLKQILLYPGAFVVDRPVNQAGGVQMEQRRALAGESWVQGQVLLSWSDVQAGAADPEDGHNVVIHEFAHQLDQAKGHANGAPQLASKQAYRQWSTVMQNEYDALRARLAMGEAGLIDAYGATDPAEFFAVSSELFFERPLDLAQQHPALYGLLRDYYRINPLNWN